MTVKSKLDAIATTTEWLKGANAVNERCLVNLEGQSKNNATAIEALKTAQSIMETKLNAIALSLEMLKAIDTQLKSSASSIEALKTAQSTIETKLNAIANSLTALTTTDAAQNQKLASIHNDTIAKTDEILSKMNNLITVGKPKV